MNDTIYIHYRSTEFDPMLIKPLTQIEIIDNIELSKEQELTDDLIQIITVFANRLYGQRSAKTRKLISEVMRNADGKEDQVITDSRTGDSVP